MINPYDETYFNSGNYIGYLDRSERYIKLSQEILELLVSIKYIKTTDKILDYGCATGFLLNGLYSHGYTNTHGYDISDWALSKLDKEKHSVIDLEEENQKFDMGFFLDVLEHIYISDLKNVISDLYYYASKIVVLQVACYEAKAKLPNGENAHITVRNPLWWKGFIDAISSNFESTKTALVCSTAFRKALIFNVWSVNSWNETLNYKVDL